ncbi:glycoside hydrolase family 85 protein [Peniophora sp. CONT]|nr:glycoside hydrolase family 85 protein [Peniophora sp. CONT]
MPTKGPSSLEKPYFSTLAELDAWADAGSRAHDGVLPYTPRRALDTIGRLMVCHDFKGGYAEDPNEVGYTFNFWPWCDSFIYFSHHRVTIPPPGWITAAHRHGTKMLGTLIFEHEQSEPDGLRLLFGRLPSSITGPAQSSPTHNPNAMPVSAHYAVLLAELAAARGFDGWLLNFEWALRADGGVGHARSLAAWVGILTGEMKKRVGEHAEVVWYDSVVFTGQVRWQDRLNVYNLPFFTPSTGFFTNYTWHQSYPAQQAAYFTTLAPTTLASPHTPPKSLLDIYAGIDVYGRGSHGGGGFGSYRALEHIVPAGLSTALFGQGWTWESTQDDEGFTWERWWDYERALWLGPTTEAQKSRVVVPPGSTTKKREEDEECPHGPFKPLKEFFGRKRSPPGWWVDGKRVSSAHWTDVGKQCSLGDLLWPVPAIAWEDRETDEVLPTVAPEVDFEDAWIGGSSLRVKVDVPGSNAEDAFFRCIWLPIQSVDLTSGRKYEATLVLKTDTGASSVDLDVGLLIKPDGFLPDHLELQPVTVKDNLPGGWTQQSLSFSISEDGPDGTAHIGLVVGFATEEAAQALSFSLILGQLSVIPAAPAPAASASTRILWADFTPSTSDADFAGVLSWGTALYLPQTILPSMIPPPDSPDPLWPAAQLPLSDALAYVNVYALPKTRAPEGPGAAVFVGTSGLEGWASRMRLSREGLKVAGLGKGEMVRVYVQGVTEGGEVLGWDRCAFVDATLG